MESKSTVVAEVQPVGVQEPIGRAKRIYRGTLLQAVIVGLVSFMNPGIWNALNSKSIVATFSKLSRECWS